MTGRGLAVASIAATIGLPLLVAAGVFIGWGAVGVFFAAGWAIELALA